MTEVLRYYVPTPDPTIFANRDKPTDYLLKQQPTTHIIQEIIYGQDGISMRIKDAPYLRKGFPFPEAIHAINISKSALMQFNHLPVIFSLKAMLSDFLRTSTMVMTPYYLKPEFMTPAAREIEVFLAQLFKGLNFNQGLARVISHIIEYDNAYRYRMQDLFSETSQEILIMRPWREVNRLMGLLFKRESNIAQKRKIKKLRRIIWVLLLRPKYREAFRNSIGFCLFRNLQYDEADRYWISLWDGYDFCGKTYFERKPKVIPDQFYFNRT